MCNHASFVYHASSVDTIGRIGLGLRAITVQLLTARYFQQWWARYSSTIAIFIHRLHWTPPLILIVLSRLERGIQSATETLPLKTGAGCCRPYIVLTAPPRLSYMRLADALVLTILFMISWTITILTKPHQDIALSIFNADCIISLNSKKCRYFFIILPFLDLTIGNITQVSNLFKVKQYQK